MARILIADRVPFMSNITTFALQYGGHDVVEVAVDGEQAIEYHMSLEPDLTILEIMLPKLNGIEVLEKLKRISPGSKIIICSTVRKDAMIERAMAHGAESYIIKPFQILSFLSEIRRIVGDEEICPDLIQKHATSQDELNKMLGKILTRSITPEEISAFLKDKNR
ncbi:MAG: two-component system response regulator [Methanomicrobiales archaeon HGW-Methanomicrobiales-4]|nr:MAG: two-component system response regulator [Methanomicrobiales archaeon HGW-Methanomicrobiales-4]